MDIKTFVFLDSETTGLPCFQHNKTRITELCFTAVQSEHISMGVYPRVQNKISFCFNPMKYIDADATTVSGLSNDLLENQPVFDSICFGTIREFLNVHRKPICFVAHNGNQFDYPILKSEINKTGKELPDGILCVDSLLAFRDLHKNMSSQSGSIHSNGEVNRQRIWKFKNKSDIQNNVDISENGLRKLTVEEIQKINETTPVKNKSIVGITKCENEVVRSTSIGIKRQKLFHNGPSFKLSHLYERLTKKQPTNAHEAEYDVTMLIECAATVGQPFVDWCNLNAKQFCDIPMMTPGKKIGS